MTSFTHLCSLCALLVEGNSAVRSPLSHLVQNIVVKVFLTLKERRPTKLIIIFVEDKGTEQDRLYQVDDAP